MNDVSFELDRGEILSDGTVDIAADAKRLQEFKVGGLVIEDVKDWLWEIMTGSGWNCDNCDINLLSTTANIGICQGLKLLFFC